MTPTMVAVLLRPLFSFAVMVAIVLPIEWVLFRMIPSGRLKVMLFRSRTGANACPGDKRVMTMAVVIAYVLLFAWLGMLSEHP
jgi:hypothetical protein